MRKALALFCLLAFSSDVYCQNTGALVRSFLSTLKEQQLGAIQFSFDDNERYNWHFISRTRRGLALKRLDAKQREALLSIMKNVLGEKGYHKSTSIAGLEDILRQLEEREKGVSHRDPLDYYASIFGQPSVQSLWAFRFEGHHLSLNFTFRGDEMISATPSSMGAYPATIPITLAIGTQILKRESDLGFILVNSLSRNQLKKAVISANTPDEIISGNDLFAQQPEGSGIRFDELSNDQQKTLKQLLDVYVQNYQLEFATRFMNGLREDGIENLSFAWAGSLQPGDGHYYRIQSPTLLIEFINVEAGADHIHTVVRDLDNDFADEFIRMNN